MKNTLALLLSISSIILTPLYSESGLAIITGTTPESKVTGSVTFEETSKGLKIVANISNLSPGSHGFHIHEFGATTNAGMDTGGHYNPTNSPHGCIAKGNYHEAHAGDLGNIIANEKGDGLLEITVPGLKLSNGTFTVAGRAVIVHEKEDIYIQPTGGAGARIGAGVITIIR